MRSKKPCTASIPDVPNTIDANADDSLLCGKSISSKMYQAPRQNEAEQIPIKTWYNTVVESAQAAKGDWWINGAAVGANF